MNEEIVAPVERLQHGVDRRVAVFLEKAPQRAGVAQRRLQMDMGGLRPAVPEAVGIEAIRFPEGRTLGWVVENARRGIATLMQQGTVNVPPPAAGCCLPRGIVILCFVGDQGIELRPSFPGIRIGEQGANPSGKGVFVECPELPEVWGISISPPSRASCRKSSSQLVTVTEPVSNLRMATRRCSWVVRARL